MLLVDNLSAAEVFPGAGVAAIAATGATLVRAQRGPGAWPRLRWLARLWRPLLAAPRDLIIVLGAVLPRLFPPGRPRGATRTLPFSAVGNEPENQVRRALAQSAGS